MERLRARGARYLVLPAPTLWWLDHYEGLRGHLERHGKVVSQEEDVGVIFELNSPDGAQP